VLRKVFPEAQGALKNQQNRFIFVSGCGAFAGNYSR
jgi:hypothetical protein